MMKSLVCLFFLGLAIGSLQPTEAAPARNGNFELIHIVRGVQATQAKSKVLKYNTFLNYVNKAGLIKPLSTLLSTTTTGVTLLMPTDAAFRALTLAQKKKLVSIPKLRSVIQFHIILRKYPWPVFLKQAPGKEFATYNGAFLQRWPGYPANTIVVGPAGSKSAAQLVRIAHPSVYADSVAAAHGLNKVLLPLTF